VSACGALTPRGPADDTPFGKAGAAYRPGLGKARNLGYVAAVPMGDVSDLRNGVMGYRIAVACAIWCARPALKYA